MRCVYTFNVKAGVGLCVTQALGLFERHIKVQALFAHLRQNEVGGAIDDARNPLNSVGGQAFTQGLDDGNASSYRSLKGHHDALGIGGFKNFGAMHCQQGFVGGDHMLACCNGFKDHGFGNAITTNEFNHNVNVRIGNDLSCIAHHLHIGAGQ